MRIKQWYGIKTKVLSKMKIQSDNQFYKIDNDVEG